LANVILTSGQKTQENILVTNKNDYTNSNQRVFLLVTRLNCLVTFMEVAHVAFIKTKLKRSDQCKL